MNASLPSRPDPIRSPTPTAAPPQTLGAAERLLVVATLSRCRGNRSLAAQQLGISRTTLYRKMREYGLGQP